MKEGMKVKKIIAATFASLFLLAGCTGNGEENSMINSDSNNEESRSEQSAQSSSLSEIVGTNQYGRGAKSDGQDTNNNEAPTRILTEDADAIVIYFSRSGNTENLVKMIQKQKTTDVLELTISEPYPEDYDETVARANKEREDEDFPEINTEIPDLSQYERVYLGYQTWAMSLSHPIISFLENYGERLDGKIIYPFSSNAGYGEGNSLERIQEWLPNSPIEESFSIEDKEVISSQAQIAGWLSKE